MEDELQQRLRQWELSIHGKREKKNALLAIRQGKQGELEACQKDSQLLDQVMILYQNTSQFARTQATKQIESIVTSCLQNIFPEPYQFQVELTEKRGMPHGDFYIETPYGDGTISTQPEFARGGGVVDIISLALRIAFLETTRPKITGPLMLDEPGKHVSTEFIENLGMFLSQSSKVSQRQMIMVTHNPHLLALGDQCYYVEKKDGVSMVTLETNPS